MSQQEIRYLCLRVFVAQGDAQYHVRLAELWTAMRKRLGDATNLIYLGLKAPNPTAEPSAPKSGTDTTDTMDLVRIFKKRTTG
jgi:hypothetical protein